jgi:hypothetical protein
MSAMFADIVGARVREGGVSVAFQSSSSAFDVLILSPKAGGVGLTITAANNVIHLSRWWNPAVEDQATDRAYRIGQYAQVTIHILMAIHPDEAIARRASISASMFHGAQALIESWPSYAARKRARC